MVKLGKGVFRWLEWGPQHTAQTVAVIVRDGDSGNWRENCEADVEIGLQCTWGWQEEMVEKLSVWVHEKRHRGRTRRESVKISLVFPGDPVVKTLPLSNPDSAVPSLVRKLRSHRPLSKKKKKKKRNRSNNVMNSIKTLKNCPHQKSLLKVK